MQLLEVKIENISNRYSASNDLECDSTNKDHKYYLFKQFFAFHYKRSSIAPLTDYANDPIC